MALEGSPTGVVVEMSILDGNKYDQLFPEGAAHCDLEGLNECALLMGNEASAICITLVLFQPAALQGDSLVDAVCYWYVLPGPGVCESVWLMKMWLCVSRDVHC